MKINKNIKVAIRLRPSEQTNLTYTNKDISFDNQENVCFTFDRVFDPYATNQ